MTDVLTVRAGVLDVAYERSGPAGGPSVVLLHGFPYDVRCYDDVVRRLVDRDVDVVVPYLRGYGPTSFVDDAVVRSGQQAALAHDLLELVTALGLDRPVVAGFDWGGRAACLTSMLWPDRVSGLVTVGGYNVHDIASAGAPAPVEVERRFWYQYYLHGERGRRGLAANRRAFAHQLWREWSPTWDFARETFDTTATSFDNPDFVDVVVHSYRHRYGLVDGDPAYAESERRVAGLAPITVPTVVLEGRHETVEPPSGRGRHESSFTDLVGHALLDAGHAVPAEDPGGFADAVLALLR